MACSCKSKSSNGQVTAVKQVTKKNPIISASKPAKSSITRRIIYRRPI